MEKNYIKKLCAAIISSLLFLGNPLYAQGHLHENNGRARHHNFYHKVELNYGNLYSFAASSCITGVINYLMDDAFFETGLSVPIYRQNTVPPYSFVRQNMVGVKPNDLIHNFEGGLKLGYQTYNPGTFVNVGVCGVAQYKHEPFTGQTTIDDDRSIYSSLLSRLLVGGNFMLMLGDMGSGTQVIFEAGLRYSIGLKYEDPYPLSSANLNNGLVSHYAVSIGGPRYLQNIKIFTDVSHFKVVDTDYLTMSPIYVGLSWTVTPRQSYNKRGN